VSAEEYARPTNPWQADTTMRIERLEHKLSEMSLREHQHPIEDKLKRWTGADNSLELERSKAQWKERAIRAEAELARLHGQFRFALSRSDLIDAES
jgi:predicted  nucleic acid-binding Zn-ribbon protein